MISVVATRKRRQLLGKDGWLPVLSGLVALMCLAGGVEAYWAMGGAGAGNGPVGTLPAPTVGGGPGAGTATLAWNAVTPPGLGPISYFVQRNGGNPAGDCPTQAAPTSVLTCTDSGLARGTYTYTVTVTWRSWTTASAPTQVTLVSGALDHFVVSAATTTPTAGQADNLTITAADSAGNAVAAYSGTHCLAFSGPGVSPNGTAPTYPPQGSCPAGQSGVAFANGSGTATATLYKVETASIVVSDGSHTNGAGLSVTVGSAALGSFTIPTPGTQTAGVQFQVSIAAKDAYGNTATTYTGAHCLTFSGPGASPNGTAPTYPAQGSCAAGQSAVTFTSGAAAAIPITLYNPSTTTVLTATDVPSGKNGATGAFTVTVGSAASFAITTPGTQTAGTQFSASISARDSYGSPVTAYTGLHCLAFSGPGASPNGTAPIYPAQGACAAGQSAVTFANGAASAPVTLYNASTTTVLTVTSGAMVGSSGAFTVQGATAASLRLAAATTTPIAGAPDNLTITALDQYGNVSPSYTGSHNLTFSGATAIPNSPFTPNVTNGAGAAVNFGTATAITFTNGVATVSGSANGVMRLYDGGTFSIVVSDGTYTNGTGLSVTVSVVATAVSSGDLHTCALLSYGGIECWGNNAYGQLGNGTVTNSTSPVAVRNITNAVAISAGTSHTCALLSTGVVDCWGLNTYGQLGNNSTTNSSSPVAVSNIANATGVSAGYQQTCALLSTGAVNCWGRNNYGQLGNNTTTNSSIPVAVSGIANATVVSAGYYHSCARLSTGVVDCWGRNQYGQLGNNSTTTSYVPVAVSNITNATTVSAGYQQTCALLATGVVDCWGRNNYGQLGNNSNTTSYVPVAVSNITNATTISAGYTHTCARLSTGVVDCWGRNQVGQLGNSTTTDSWIPVAVTGIANATMVSAGNGTTNEHTCALLSTGAVVCWGYNGNGQLGNGGVANSSVPVSALLQ